MAKKKKPLKARRLHPLIMILILCLLAVAVFLLINNLQTRRFQSSLNNFYNTSDIPLQGPLGELIRSEPVATDLQNGSANRIIYRTQKKDGAITFSSGMIYIPSKAAVSPRPIMAWAHGTIGMGDSCAPSRQKVPNVNNGITWVDSMLEKGWVVTATDYAGLGTPGTEAYLVGQAEANDVLNSVRAAKNFNGSDAGNDYAVWGHSQGGHSALFSSARARSYLPDFKLVGTVASAPAAELPSLFSQQENTAVAWIIGPEASLSWSDNYPGINLSSVLTKQGLNSYKGIAEKCINQAAIDGLVRQRLGQKFFNEDVSNNSAWQAILNEQTAPALAPNQPLMVAESLTDNVVLPNTTARYIQRSCQAGSNLTQLWLTNVNHIALQTVISPSVINWLDDRFNGRPNVSNCNQPLPIAPAQ
jgi:hypothetical protein